jgi:hypothetical protein
MVAPDGGGGGAGGTKDAGIDSMIACGCPATAAPVCGSDGKMYSNSCLVTCVGLYVLNVGPCTDAGRRDADETSRVSCETDLDCVFQPIEGCCGACITAGLQPLPSGCPIIIPDGICAGIEPPGGCSCVNHMCQPGILQLGAACDTQQDRCGMGLACCVPCGTAPVDGATCAAPSCVNATIVLETATCPLFP